MNERINQNESSIKSVITFRVCVVETLTLAM